MTCCFFSSLKTLLTSTEGNPSRRINVLDSVHPLAGFQVTIIGRFWVTPEGEPHSALGEAFRFAYAHRVGEDNACEPIDLRPIQTRCVLSAPHRWSSS